MWSARLRLAVAALLFLLWIGWLAFLAATTTHPVVLSRPQFLVANLCVSADLEAAPGDPDHPAAVVKVEEVFWPEADQKLRNSELTIADLSQLGPRQGWGKPGRYILPLTRDAQGSCTVTPVPRSPGFSGVGERVRIYPDTPQTRAQLHEIKALRQ